MRRPSGDSAEYQFLTTPGATVECRLASEAGEHELQLFGNRAGLLSLANVLLWFLANSWRREFLSLGELCFARLAGELALCIRITDDTTSNPNGTVQYLDGGKSLEWAITEEGLQRVALLMHRLVSTPTHEYDRLLMARGSVCDVHVRMIDATDWIV